MGDSVFVANNIRCQLISEFGVSVKIRPLSLGELARVQGIEGRGEGLAELSSSAVRIRRDEYIVSCGLIEIGGNSIDEVLESLGSIDRISDEPRVQWPDLLEPKAVRLIADEINGVTDNTTYSEDKD